jgi:phosphomethylpyrimidine synthase
MKISQEVRDFAAKKDMDEQAAIEAGMKEKSKEFADNGSEVYL